MAWSPMALLSEMRAGWTLSEQPDGFALDSGVVWSAFDVMVLGNAGFIAADSKQLWAITSTGSLMFHTLKNG